MAYIDQISVYEGELGITTGMTALRDLTIAQRTTVISDSLADGISSFWTQTAASGGTITSTSGEGQLKTSTSTTGSIYVVSPTTPYLPGQVAWFNSAARFGDTGVAGDIRRIGMFTMSGTTPQEGFYYELTGTTFNAVVVKGGSATATAQASWSAASTNPFTLDANYHSFEIRFTANSVWFYIDGKLRHAVSGTTTPLTTTITLPLTIQNTKTSGATDITFGIRNIGTGRFGEPSSAVTETGLLSVNAIAVGGGTPNDSVDSGNPQKIGGYAKATAPTAVADGDRVNAWFGTTGALNVLDAGGSLTVDAPVATPLFVRLSDGASAISTLPVSIAATVATASAPATSGGLSVFHLVSAGTTNATNIKNSAGQVYGWYIYNSNASARKVAFHNTSGSPTAGASIFFTLVIPGSSGANVEMSNGIAFSSGIAITTVTDLTDAGTTAVAANDLNINIFYK